MFRNWKISTFGDVNKQVLETERRLLEVHQRFSSNGFSESIFHEKVYMHKSLGELLVRKK